MSDSTDTKTLEALTRAVLRILRPLVRMLLRYGVPYGTFADLAKWVYVDVATQEFALTGRKQTTSRVSVLTGLSRKEVSRVRGLSVPQGRAESQRYNRAARVISGWLRDPTFHDASGHPAKLQPEGPAPSFAALVRAHSGDVPARAILDELLRVGAADYEDGVVELRTRAYVPSTAEVDKLDILGWDVADLASTIDHNLTEPPSNAFFQRKVSYNNLSAEGLDRIREIAATQGQGLLEYLNERMAPLDRDVNPEAKGTGRKRAMLGLYYFETDYEDDDA